MIFMYFKLVFRLFWQLYSQIVSAPANVAGLKNNIELVFLEGTHKRQKTKEIHMLYCKYFFTWFALKADTRIFLKHLLSLQEKKNFLDIVH